MKTGKVIFVTMSPLLFLLPLTAAAQTGGNFTITQSVIAGGGENSTGGAFSLNGTIGQTLAGTRSTAAPFNVYSGFYTNNSITTAAAISISGSVANGKRGISNAIVYLTPPSGETRQTTVDLWGNFSFEDVRAGETYVINVFHKRYTFQAQVVTASDNITDLIFIAQ